jgi:hypothetical protein
MAVDSDSDAFRLDMIAAVAPGVGEFRSRRSIQQNE